MDHTTDTASINTASSINPTEPSSVIEDTAKQPEGNVITDTAEHLDANVASPAAEHKEPSSFIEDTFSTKDFYPSSSLLDNTYIIEYYWNNKKTLVHDYEIEASQKQLKENNMLILIDFSNTEDAAEALFITNHGNVSSYLFVNPEVYIDYDVCYSTGQDIIII